MADIVCAIGTSFSPLLLIAPEDWAEYCQGDRKRPFNRRDGTLITHDELQAENGDKYASRATVAEFRRAAKIAQGCLDRIAAELAAAQPDVIVVVADDHAELFDSTNFPTVAVYRGATLASPGLDRRMSGYMSAQSAAGPAWRAAIKAAQTIEAQRHYPGNPAYADALVRGMIEENIDVAVATEPKDPVNAGLGFGWGFVVNRLLANARIPIVPVLLNTHYPPNVPTPGRCFQIGQALRAAIAGSGKSLRVAVICAGGMSHLGIDEELDRRVLEATRTHDAAAISALPREALIAGSCQLLNWALLAGVVQHLDNRWLEYLPVYRTAAGTGIGLAFAAWS
ncbi:MAG: hypothetical protein WDO72_04715 [Pseudomonadota bacterium]